MKDFQEFFSHYCELFGQVFSWEDLGFFPDKVIRVDDDHYCHYFNMNTDAAIIVNSDNVLMWYITKNSQVYSFFGKHIGCMKMVYHGELTQWEFVDSGGTRYPGRDHDFCCYDAEPTCFKNFLLGNAVQV